MTEIEAFTRYRQQAGLTHKYESTNCHHISLHSFRSYFFTRARRVHDTDIAHAMVGHTTYLDMYDRKDDSINNNVDYVDLVLKLGMEKMILDLLPNDESVLTKDIINMFNENPKYIFQHIHA